MPAGLGKVFVVIVSRSEGGEVAHGGAASGH